MAVSLLRTGMCSFRLYPQHVESAHTTGSTRYIPAAVVITLPWRFAPRNPINTTPFSLPLHDSDEEMGTQRSSSFSPRQASKQQSGPLSSPQFSPTMSPGSGHVSKGALMTYGSGEPIKIYAVRPDLPSALPMVHISPGTVRNQDNDVPQPA